MSDRSPQHRTNFLQKKMTTWQQEVKACAKRYKAKRERKTAKAKAKAKPEPPKITTRIRRKQQDPTRDIN